MKERENWSSKLAFILAASGSAIGLGNIWRFPYITGSNGGAVFLIIYLAVVFLIGYPIIISEMVIGKKTQKNPVGAFKSLAPDTPWWLVGSLGVLSGFIILSYYSVVAGWGMSYIFKSFSDFSPVTDFTALFNEHISSITAPILWHGLFILLTVLTISAGVVKGIQKIVKILMPLLFIIIIFLIIRAVTLPGAFAGLSFYIKPDLSKITIQTFIDAISQSFFTLSLGMGAIITYGSYLSKKENISDNAAYVIIFDTLFAILAGFAIFPAVFAFGFSPDAGPGLTFITLPAVFAEMPLGGLFGALFFLLITIAALTSSISMLEVVVAYMVDEKKWSRKKASFLMGGLIFLVGIPTILGYSSLSNLQVFNMNLLDSYDWISNTILLPLGGFLTSIYVGYFWKAKNAVIEINKYPGKIKLGFCFGILTKYIAPTAILIIMIINIWQKIF